MIVMFIIVKNYEMIILGNLFPWFILSKIETSNMYYFDVLTFGEDGGWEDEIEEVDKHPDGWEGRCPSLPDASGN